MMRPRVNSYLIASAVVLVWAVGVVLADTWVGDFQLHVATVRTLAGNVTHPPDPMVGTGDGGPYYSPYMLVLAVIVRLTGAAPAPVVAWFAIPNVVLLLVALRRLVGRLGGSAAAATVALAALLLLWGPGSAGWSGFPDVRSLAETLPYPSTLAFGLMLVLWERLLAFREGIGPLVAIGVLAAAIVLVHPFTAVETGVGAVAILIGGYRTISVRWWLALAGTATAAVAVAALWPYSSLVDLFAGASALVEVHRPLRLALLDRHTLICGYGLLGLPALVLRWRRDRTDPLVLMFVLGAVVVAAAVLTRQHQFLRVIPVMMLPLQVAFGMFVVDRAAPAAARVGTAAAAALVFVAGFAVNTAPGLGVLSALPVRWLPRAVADDLRTLPIGADPTDRVRQFAPPGSTVLTDSKWTDRRLNLLGYYAVNPGWPNPWIGDQDARATARQEFLGAATTPAQRGEIARWYGARCVLLTRTPGIGGPDAVDGYRQVSVAGNVSLYCA
ncbi:MAG TPA: hypothetical protein VFE14_18050 [Micromonosporaceae bacterium]|jgi:hypothetical protein|nr:hypothetical protein [Micromonosporaceae bacterium]